MRWLVLESKHSCLLELVEFLKIHDYAPLTKLYSFNSLLITTFYSTNSWLYPNSV